MIRPAVPQPSSLPDLATLRRQRSLEDVVLSLLAESMWDDEIDGIEYAMQVDDTSGGIIKASLHIDSDDGSHEVATLVLDFTLTPSGAMPVLPGTEVEAPRRQERPSPAPDAGGDAHHGGSECHTCGKDTCACYWGGAS